MKILCAVISNFNDVSKICICHSVTFFTKFVKILSYLVETFEALIRTNLNAIIERCVISFNRFDRSLQMSTALHNLSFFSKYVTFLHDIEQMQYFLRRNFSVAPFQYCMRVPTIS